MRKKNNPYLGAMKLQWVTGLINFSYEDLTNQQMPEGDQTFKAGPRVWGRRVPNTPLVEHNGALYLEVANPKDLGDPQYFFNNDPIDTALLSPFLQERDSTTTGIVHPKDFKISGIISITLNGETHRVE